MSKSKNLSQKLPQQLLVEGDNDRHVIWALCSQYQLPQNFSVEILAKNDGEGIDALLSGLPVKLKEENLRTLGIVVDADVDPGLANRWKAIQHKLIHSGYTNIPELPPPNGWVYQSLDPYLPRVGVWLMPDNQIPGMLEDFVVRLIPSGDVLLTKADSVLQEVQQISYPNRYTEAHRPKALIHTWLAWQKKPGMPMGQAITAKALKYDSEIALTFTAWLRNLFQLPHN